MDLKKIKLSDVVTVLQGFTACLAIYDEQINGTARETKTVKKVSAAAAAGGKDEC